MRATPTTALRFLASLAMAFGLGGGVVLGAAYLVPPVLAHYELDVWNLPGWLTINGRAPAEIRRLEEAIRRIEEGRQVRERIMDAVLDGAMSEAEGLAAFRDLAEGNPDLVRRLEVTWGNLDDSDRVRHHYTVWLAAAREDRVTRSPTPTGPPAL